MTVIMWVAPAEPRLDKRPLQTWHDEDKVHNPPHVADKYATPNRDNRARPLLGCGVKGAFEIKVYGPYFQGVKFYFQQMSGGGQVPPTLLSQV